MNDPTGIRRWRWPTVIAPPDWLARTGSTALGVLLLLVVSIILGFVGASRGTLAILLAVGVLGICIVATDLGLLTVLAFPAALVMIRSGPLSVADLVLGMATGAAVLLLRRQRTSDLQPLMAVGVCYLACLVPTLLLNRYLGNLIEWTHEAVMILGSLVVGWVAGRRGQARSALTGYVLGCHAIAIAAFIYAIYLLATTDSFGPAYLPFLHKNFIGNSLALAFVMVYVRPDWARWSPLFTRFTMVLCAAGIAAANSRQAIISVFVAMVLLTLWDPKRRTGKAALLPLLLLPVIWFTAASVTDQLESDNQFNSASQRVSWFAEAIEVWRESPLFGVGLRWWNTGNYPAFQPPNAQLEMLSSAGVVGLIGFLILMFGGLWVVHSINPRFGNIVFVVMIARFTQGLLDLYWVAGQSALPWMIAGLALGAQAVERAQSQGRTPMPPPTTTSSIGVSSSFGPAGPASARRSAPS